jgi:hypothetical protein
MNLNLCKYKDIFGRPKEGVHSRRIFDIAVMDVIATLVLAALITWYSQIPIWKTSLALFTAGIVLHRAFCVRTTIDKLIFKKSVRFE